MLAADGSQAQLMETCEMKKQKTGEEVSNMH